MTSARELIVHHQRSVQAKGRLHQVDVKHVPSGNVLIADAMRTHDCYSHVRPDLLSPANSLWSNDHGMCHGRSPAQLKRQSNHEGARAKSISSLDPV